VLGYLQGYDAFVTVMYVIGGLIVLSVVLMFWLALLLRKDEKGNVFVRR
jgi:hypothetical protein